MALDFVPEYLADRKSYATSLLIGLSTYVTIRTLCSVAVDHLLYILLPGQQGDESHLTGGCIAQIYCYYPTLPPKGMGMRIPVWLALIIFTRTVV